ncbi:MAG: hypothetical protein WAQ29_10320 [Nitrososphaeraceae archaeon]
MPKQQPEDEQGGDLITAACPLGPGLEDPKHVPKTSMSDSTNPVPFRVHVESPAAILAFDYFRRGYSENSNTNRDLINSAKEFELDKVVESIVHIEADNNRLRNSRSVTFTYYKSNI